MFEQLRGLALRHGTPVWSVATALMVSLVARDVFHLRTPYFFFATAVVVSAYHGGFVSGLVATLLAAFTSAFFIHYPVYSFAIANPDDLLVATAFTVEGVVLSLLMTVLKSVGAKGPLSLTGRYGGALLAVAVAVVLKMQMDMWRAFDLPFVLFYASVLASAWVGGLGPGLFTTALGAAVGAYFFCEPRYSFDIASPTHVMRLGVFVMEGVLLSLFGTTIFASRERAWEMERQAGSAREEVRQGEQRLREARGRIVEQALLLDQARDAIFLEDLSGRITYWNQGAERCYGWGAADAVGRESAALLFPPAQASPLAEAGRAVVERGQWEGELVQTTRQGGEVIVEARLAKVFDEAGQPRGVLHIATDVTQRKKLEAHLLRAQRMDSVGSLTSGIVHDLKNVLTPIVMALDLLEQTQHPEERSRLFQALRIAAQQGTSLVKQIIAFVRGEVKLTRIQGAPLLADLQRLLSHTMPGEIVVTASAPDDLPAVWGDETQLAQVLLNLALNARDAMPQGGELTITAETVALAEDDCSVLARAGEYVLFRVRDTGVGMPPEVLDNLFQPFFTTKPTGKGSGLGLFMVRTIVLRMNGCIQVRSTPGAGSEFLLHLPAAAREEPAAPLVESAVTAAGEVVLVLDHEASMRELARGALEAHGYRVLAASNFLEALAHLTQNAGALRVALIHLSPDVPEGTALLAEVRRLAPRAVVLATAPPELSLPTKVARSVRVLMIRPYSAEELLRTVGEVLRDRRAAGMPEPERVS